MRRSIHPWRDWASYRRLFRLLAEIQPQIVHTHSSKAGILGRRPPRAVSAFPPCTRSTARPFITAKARSPTACYIAAEKWAAPRCRRLISVCDAMTDHYVQAGIAPRGTLRHDLQRHGGRAVLEPAATAGNRPCGTGLPARARRDHESRAAVSSQRATNSSSRRPAESSAQHPNVRFLFVGDGILREPIPRADRARPA